MNMAAILTTVLKDDLGAVSRQIQSIERLAEMAEAIAADVNVEDHEKKVLDLGDLAAATAELARAAQHALSELRESAARGV